MFFLAEFSVIKPYVGLLFWATLIFLLFWFILGKFFFKPIVQALKDRENDIQSSLDQAKKAREEMSHLVSQHEALLAEAREERSKILKEAKDIRDNIVNEAKEKAKEESNRIVSSAMHEIDNQKMAAKIDLKNMAGKMAIDIAEKILQKELKGNPEQESFVKKLVDNINLS